MAGFLPDCVSALYDQECIQALRKCRADSSVVRLAGTAIERLRGRWRRCASITITITLTVAIAYIRGERHSDGSVGGRGSEGERHD